MKPQLLHVRKFAYCESNLHAYLYLQFKFALLYETKKGFLISKDSYKIRDNGGIK